MTKTKASILRVCEEIAVIAHGIECSSEDDLWESDYANLSDLAERLGKLVDYYGDDHDRS